jgi:hypothetical protein
MEHALRCLCVRKSVVIVAVVGLATGSAAAEHDHGPHGHDHDHAGGDALIAGVSVLAATYESMLFAGEYQGVGAVARWARGRLGASASITGYRLTKNGRAVRGLGDPMLDAHLTLATRGTLVGGVALGVSLPTGDDIEGIGMGHAMVMPAVWGAWAADAVGLSATIAYHRGLGDESIHAEHGGAWPLVDPMSYQEIAYGATATYALARALQAGVRVAGAVPIGDGDTRLVAGVRAVWIEGRVETAFEVQTGLVGDPFEVRGLLETGIRLR